MTRVNDVPTPRLLCVFEGLVAHPPERGPSLSPKRWTVDCRFTAHLYDVDHRSPYIMDVVTLRSARFAEAAERWMLERHIAFGEMYFVEDPATLQHTEHLVVYYGHEEYRDLLPSDAVFLANPDFFDVVL